MLYVPSAIILLQICARFAMDQSMSFLHRNELNSNLIRDRQSRPWHIKLLKTGSRLQTRYIQNPLHFQRQIDVIGDS